MSGKARNQGIRSKWSRQELENAVTAVQEGRMSRQGASKTFSIPRRTLSRYVDSNQTSKARMGRKPVLTTDQERELSARIIRLAEVGYPLTSRTLRRCVFNFCTENGIQNKFSTMSKMAGRYWLHGFLTRNPSIRQRKAQSMNPARAQKLNRFIVNDYFAKLREVLLELDLMDSPEKIFNVDEKGCRLSLHHQQSVLAKKGAKRVHLVAPEHGENVTIVSCGNACGNAIPPTILFKGKRLKPEWKDTLPPGSLVLMTPKGSMNIATFCTWIEHLAKYKPPGKCLLIFDGAKCHLDHTIVDVAERHNVALFCLPSNTTHELQPMDKSVFRSFEYHWDDQVLQYWTRYKDRNITKQRFGEIFSVVWDKSVTPANIKAGFAATGIFPFNPEAIPELAFAPSEVTQVGQEPQEPIVEPTRGASPKAGPSKIRNRPRSPSSSSDGPQEPIVEPTRAASSKAGPSKIRKRPRSPSSSSDDDSSEENTPPFMDTSDSNDDLCPSNELLSRSITEILETPEKIVKSVTNVRQKAINSRALLVKKAVFDKSETASTSKVTSTPKATTKPEATSKPKDSTHKTISTVTSQAKATMPKATSTFRATTSRATTKKNTTEEADEQDWYCAVCQVNEISDMRLCIVCQKYIHEDCVGLTKEMKDNFICPLCE